ncbi:farnesyl pyrophosphate synthase [Schistosoma mansoni]|uniref:Farnesyl pyrophosphate synthase n=1 Tax=Schistosoma mansoni TaxID=6183 RepID=G4VEL6_SCHMA|nr:farnesyl pyrophosphate synthase [Schistosoma mansoni]|eukprot:XP_018650986.1 farnesyl pyrophosphate synthase [Schistosoma mansoni]
MPTSDIHIKYREVKENFENYFNTFVNLLRHVHPKSLELAEQHFQNVTSYNLSSGKRIRGVLVVLSYMVFSNKNENSRKNLSCVYLIGWCVELLHAGFLVLDDIIDNSTLRRGQPCWHCTQIDSNRGLIGVNDGLHLILSSKYLIHSLFAENQSDVDSYSWKDKNNVYLKLCKLFDEISYKTCSGQCLDVLSSNPNNQCILDRKQNNLEFDSFTRNYSPDVFEAITHWKTGFYTFYLPVACGMILAEVDTDDIFKSVQHILLKLGNYFQAQDDYLDCFGDSEITGKVGTDIAEGKCTWLIVEALKYLSPEQYEILKTNYGKPDLKSQQTVRNLYDTIKLPEKYHLYEEQTKSEIMITIQKFTYLDHFSFDPRDLFTFLVELLFQRAC